jgi:hypothetical protein
LHCACPVGVHPDQKLAVGPATSCVDRREEQNHDEISAHGQNSRKEILLPGFKAA